MCGRLSSRRRTRGALFMVVCTQVTGQLVSHTVPEDGMSRPPRPSQPRMTPPAQAGQPSSKAPGPGQARRPCDRRPLATGGPACGSLHDETRPEQTARPILALPCVLATPRLVSGEADPTLSRSARIRSPDAAPPWSE